LREQLASSAEQTQKLQEEAAELGEFGEKLAGNLENAYRRNESLAITLKKQGQGRFATLRPVIADALTRLRAARGQAGMAPSDAAALDGAIRRMTKDPLFANKILMALKPHEIPIVGGLLGLDTREVERRRKEEIGKLARLISPKVRREVVRGGIIRIPDEPRVPQPEDRGKPTADENARIARLMEAVDEGLRGLAARNVKAGIGRLATRLGPQTASPQPKQELMARSARIQELMARSPKELENDEIWRSMTPQKRDEALSRFERDERNRLFERLGTAPQTLSNSDLKRLLLIVGHQRGTNFDAMRKAIILEWNLRKKK
ncbi:MAG: hypothetical protein V1881_02410, partial [Candidatus Micrarchaeota archaeon]